MSFYIILKVFCKFCELPCYKNIVFTALHLVSSFVEMTWWWSVVETCCQNKKKCFVWRKQKNCFIFFQFENTMGCYLL